MWGATCIYVCVTVAFYNECRPVCVCVVDYLVDRMVGVKGAHKAKDLALLGRQLVEVLLRGLHHQRGNSGDGTALWIALLVHDALRVTTL
jgi:hypothetical protein